MEANNELMILSLLNLYTSYVKLKKPNKEKECKKPISSHYSTKPSPSAKKTLTKCCVLVNQNLGITTIPILKQEAKPININPVTSSTSVNEPLDSIHVTVNTDTEEVPLLTYAEIKKRENAQKCKRRKVKFPDRPPRVRRWRVRPVNVDRIKTGYHRKVFINVKKMDEKQFFEHTRMTKSLFDWLLSFVQTSLRRSKQLILPEERLALTLNYLAYGTSLQSLAFKHKVGKSTARQIVLDTCRVLWNLLSPIYLSELTTSQYADIAEEFRSKWYIPNCVGAIDGKNVSIRLPRHKDPSDLLVLAACDTKYKFSAVTVGNFGSHSDEGVFQLNANNYATVSDKLPLPTSKPLSDTSPPFPHFFISDTSFPLQKHVMCPYQESNLDKTKNIFNCKISHSRTITENTFGILTARFRVLLTTIEFLPESCTTIVLACIALHNYIMTNDETQLYCPTNFVDRVNEFDILEEGEWRNELKNNGDQPLSSMTLSLTGRSTFEAKKLRDTLANFFSSEAISYDIDIM